MTLEILLVEDNEVHRYLAEKALQRWKSPYNLHVVSTAEEALDFLNAKNAHSAALAPHITLLDLNLPKAPGFTVLKAIKDNPKLRNIAVIVMSSSAEEADIKKAVELHANAYITKPIEWTEFEKIAIALESFWRLDARFVNRDTKRVA